MKKWTQSLRMAVRSILGKKGRSFLTMLGIIIGVAAVIFIVSWQKAKSEKDMELIQSWGVNQLSIWMDSWMLGRDITDEMAEFIRENDDIYVGFTPNLYQWGEVKYKSKQMPNTQVMLVNEQFSNTNDYKLHYGRNLAYLDAKLENRVAVVGAGVKDYLFNYQNPLGQTITVGGESFTVVGVFQAKSNGEKIDPNKDFNDFTEEDWQRYQMQQLDSIVILPYTLSKLFGGGYNADSFTVKVTSTSLMDTAKKRMERFLDRKFIGKYEGDWKPYNVYNSSQYVSETQAKADSDMLFAAGLAAVSLLVGGIGIMNIMLVTVTERTREIGIRKAIGAERRSIISQFLIEAVILSGLGGFFGMILGTLATLVVGKMSFKIILFPAAGTIFIAIGVSLIVGILFGLFPAAKASRLQPVDALRGET